MFDLNKAILSSHLTRNEIKRLQAEIKRDYPDDSMLYELHLIRALNSKKPRQKISRKRGHSMVSPLGEKSR